MKKLIFVLVAATFGLSSCSKEVKLENRLDGKWKIDSYTEVEETQVNFFSTDTAYKDSSRTESTIDPLEVKSIKGDVDFVSESKLVMHHDITTTKTKILEGGAKTTTVTPDEADFTYDYFVSGEDEVTLVELVNYGDEGIKNQYKVYNITTNEKDSQVWEYKKVTNSTDPAYGIGEYGEEVEVGYEETVTTHDIKITLSLVK